MSVSYSHEDVADLVGEILGNFVSHFNCEGVSEFVRISSGAILLQLENKADLSIGVNIGIGEAHSGKLSLGVSEEHGEVLDLKDSVALVFGLWACEISELSHEVLRL